MLNPLRSEDEAFKFLLYAIVVLASIGIAVVVLRVVL